MSKMEPNHPDIEVPPQVNVLGKNQGGVEAVFKSLLSKRDKGRHCFFQILVDSLVVVPRTDNLEEFWELLEYMDSRVEKVEILVFMGQSYRNSRHTFEYPKPKEAPLVDPRLSEEEIEKRVREEADRWKSALQIESLEAENKRLTAKVKDQSRKIKELKAELKDMSSKTFDRDNVAIAAVLNHLIVRYPAIQEQFPILKQVKGLLGLQPDPPEQEPEAAQDAETKTEADSTETAAQDSIPETPPES